MPTVWSKLIEDYSIESGKWIEYSLFVNDFFYYWSFLNFFGPMITILLSTSCICVHNSLYVEISQLSKWKNRLPHNVKSKNIPRL